mgnify:CR=1 FL=1
MTALLKAAAGALCAAALAPAAVAAPSECDRDCLVETAQDFLDAVAAHDASLLDWNAYARWTLNGIELPFSEAVWALENGVSDSYQYIVPDAETGEVGIVTTWTFDGTPALMAARLKVEWGRPSEAELIVNTQARDAETDYAALANPLLGASTAIPEASRLSRDDLAGFADSYFDGLEAQAFGPVATSCARIVNGAPMESCGLFEPEHTDTVSPRRFAAVDPSRGLVFAIVRYNDDGVREGGAPNSTLAATVLRITNSEITRIETVAEGVHYMAPTGWDGD